jgi:surface protein
MSIASEITRLNNAKAAIKQSLTNKGVEVSDSALLDEYPALIDSIPMEGGNPYYEDFYNLITNNGTDMAGLFSYCTASELDLRSLDTSKITNMQYMFAQCYSSSINIDGWDTSNVTNMSNMFYFFTGSVDISKLDTSSLTDVNNMFSNANTDNIILTGLSFPKATKLDNMFNSSTGTTLDLSSWDISNITSLYYMFTCEHKKIDLTGWKTTNVTNMSSTFYKYNSPLEELIIPDWDMTNVTSSSSFFHTNMPNLKLIDLSRSNDATITKIASFLPTRTATTFGTVLVPENISQATYDALIAKYWRPMGAAMTPAPTSIEIIAELDEILPGKSTKVYLGACEPWNADPNKAEIVLLSDSSIATMTDNEVTSTGTGNIELAVRLIDTQEIIGTKTIVVSETDSYPNLVKFRAVSTPGSYAILITVNGSGKKLSDLTYDSYADVYSYDAGVPITKIQISYSSNISELIKLNTSNITNMERMFAGCGELVSVNSQNWDTGNVTNTGWMFQNCSKLVSLDLSNWDLTNTPNAGSIFQGCNALHTLRLDNCSNDTINKLINSTAFPTNAIEGVTRTIYCKEANAAGLTPPTNWVFSYVTEEEPEVPVDPPVEEIPLYVPDEFQNNTEITEVRTMVNDSHDSLGYMFFGCSNLVSVNTEDWDTSNVTDMTGMFQDCTSLTQLDLSNFDTSNLAMMSNMFQDCTSLTTLDLSNWDTTFVFMPNWDMREVFLNCTALHTLRLDNCNNDTISKIIKSSGFPANTISGVIKTIYCKESEAAGLTVPNGWVFSFVEEEPDTCEYCGELDCDGSCQEEPCYYCGLPASECTCAPCEQCGAYDCDGSCTPCEYCGNYGCAGTCQDPCPYCGEVGCGGLCAQCEKCGMIGCDGSCVYCEQCGMYHDPGASCSYCEYCDMYHSPGSSCPETE